MRAALAKRWLIAACVCALLAGCATRALLVLQPETLGPHLRLLLGGGGNSLILLHNGEAFATDAKFGDYSRRMRQEIEEELGHKVRRIMLTHAHFDHAGGVGVFPDVGAVIVHPNAHARLDSEDVRGLPFVDVDGEIELSLGGEPVRIFHPGVGHTDGDLVAYLPARKLLVAGDLFLDDFEPYADVKYGGNMLEFSHTVQSLMSLPFERVVTGHGGVIDRAQAQRWADFFAALEREVRACKLGGGSEDACAAGIKLEQYPLRVIPFTSTREKNVRAMYRALP